jgi:hypothetical protein
MNLGHKKKMSVVSRALELLASHFEVLPMGRYAAQMSVRPHLRMVQTS